MTLSSFDSLKKFNSKVYSGMPVGSSHHWNYPDGKWLESKLAPDKWKFTFEASKRRFKASPKDSGAPLKTRYHWYILADQKAIKIDKDTYQTLMTGLKFKIGHKRPFWKDWSYTYPEQLSYKERLIKILEETLKNLRSS